MKSKTGRTTTKLKPQSTSRAVVKGGSTLVKPKRLQDISVTQGQFDSFRSENKSEHTTLHLEIKSLSKKMEARFTGLESKFIGVDARFTEIDSKFTGLDSKFKAIDAKFTAIDSKFTAMDAKLEAIRGDLHTMMLKMDEQNSRNKFVLDGYAHLYERQEVVEKKVDENLMIIREFIQASREQRISTQN